MRRSGFTTLVLIAVAAASCAPADDTADAVSESADRAAPATAAPFAMPDSGLATPESVLHDEQADIYLVSNVNGAPLEHDDNGFIARVRPDGTFEASRWIDAAADDVTLNAPKGLAILGDTLFVADIDSVRAFHRLSGAPLGVRGVPGATFLNDLASGADGALYVTDTGVDASFAPNGTEAIYRLVGDSVTAIARGEQLHSPNGIVIEDGAVVMVPFASDVVTRFLSDGTVDTVATLPGGQLDGIVHTADGGYVVSSWETGSLYRIAPDGTVSTLADSLDAPADIGYDERRARVLVPLFTTHRVVARAVP